MKERAKLKSDKQTTPENKSMKSSPLRYKNVPEQANNYLYTLEIFLISGPVTDEFAALNPIISRTIKIRGDQTLNTLHTAIFQAFEREDEHMYEFQVGGKGPQDPKAKRYVINKDLENENRKLIKCVTQTTIGDLLLQTDQSFGYWFDYGDDWWHQINVVEIEEEFSTGAYPIVIKREGNSPPQYPN